MACIFELKVEDDKEEAEGTIIGLAAPYGIKTEEDYRNATFLKGSLSANVGVVVPFYDRHMTDIQSMLTYATFYKEDANGLYFRAKLDVSTPLYKGLKEGMKMGVSVGLKEASFDEDGKGNVFYKKAVVNELSFVLRPAFKEAGVTDTFNQKSEREFRMEEVKANGQGIKALQDKMKGFDGLKKEYEAATAERGVIVSELSNMADKVQDLNTKERAGNTKFSAELKDANEKFEILEKQQAEVVKKQEGFEELLKQATSNLNGSLATSDNNMLLSQSFEEVKQICSKMGGTFFDSKMFAKQDQSILNFANGNGTQQGLLTTLTGLGTSMVFPETVRTEILKTLDNSNGLIHRATQTSNPNLTMRLLKLNNIPTAAYRQELADVQESFFDYSENSVSMHFLSAGFTTSVEALMMARIDVVKQWFKLLEISIRKAEERGFMYGDGVNQPLGIANNQEVKRIQVKDALKFGDADMEALWETNKFDGGNLAFYLHKNTLASIRRESKTMYSGVGGWGYDPTAKYPQTYNGIPIVPMYDILVPGKDGQRGFFSLIKSYNTAGVEVVGMLADLKESTEYAFSNIHNHYLGVDYSTLSHRGGVRFFKHAHSTSWVNQPDLITLIEGKV